MSLLDKASLIVTPNGYSEDTLYSVVPSSGAGDLSFTRATDAWRTNSAGLVQRTPWNLIRGSNQFDNSSLWTNSLTVSVPNSGIAPNGSNTAYIFKSTSNTNVQSIYQLYTANASGNFTTSFYVKKKEVSIIQLEFFPSPYSAEYGVNIDLVNNVYVNWASGVDSCIIENVGTDGWKRVTITKNIPATTSMYVQLFLASTINGVPREICTLPVGSGIYLWGAQLVEGSSALEYFPTTDRQNVPRIDYSLGGCPTLLMEPQRTNVLLNTVFSGSGATPTSWTQAVGTGTSLLTTSTLGLGAQACSQSATAQRPFLTQNFTLLANTTYSYSIYIESISGVLSNENVLLASGLPVGATATYFVNEVSVSSSAAAVVGRLSITIVVSVLGGSAAFRCGIGTSANSTGAILFSRPQLEAGAYATSFISTTTASVTRNVDVATKVGISSLFGQTEGTVFYEMSIPQPLGLGNQVFSNLANDAGSFFYNVFLNATGNFVFDMYVVVGIYTFTLTTSAAAVVGRNRLALVYKAGAYKVFLNGVLVATSTNSTPITNTISRPTLSVFTTPVYFYEFAAFKSALSDSELELLTGNYFDSYAKMAAFYNYTLQ